MKDASYLWWTIRPALRFPTLELRICDACTRLQDTLAIAALYRCLVSLLARRPEFAPAWTPFTRRLIDENRWRAKRFGVEAEFLAFDDGPTKKCKDVVEALLEAAGEDARRLGCESALVRIRTLLEQGTSAHRQLAIYREALAKRESRIKALQAVVDWLVEQTSLQAD